MPKKTKRGTRWGVRKVKPLIAWAHVTLAGEFVFTDVDGYERAEIFRTYQDAEENLPTDATLNVITVLLEWRAERIGK